MHTRLTRSLTAQVPGSTPGPFDSEGVSGSQRIRPCVLRLSVTERCNFRCRYCVPPGGARRERLRTLSDEELVDLVAWLHGGLSFRKIKITGGEPLVMASVAALVARVREATGIRDISMTTNGSRLGALAAPLRNAGLTRVNVSLDTLDPEGFLQLTGGRLAEALAGIEAAAAAGLLPVKLNAVLRRRSWQTDVPSLIDHAAAGGHEIRFIELMHTGTAARWALGEFVGVSEVQAWLASRAEVRLLPRPRGTPARPSVVRWGGRDAAVGWISPRSSPFCGDCDRLRLDSFGRLRRCLMDPLRLPLPDLRREVGDAGAWERTRDYLSEKRPPGAMSIESPMAAIGG